MRRHHIGKLRPAFPERSGPHAAFIHRYKRNGISKRLKNPARLLISRVFHRDRDMASEYFLKQKKQVVIPCSDNDLFRLAIHASGRVQITAYRHAQSPVPLRFTERKQAASCIHQNIFCYFLPCHIWKKRHVDRIGRKIIPVFPGIFRMFPAGGHSFAGKHHCFPRNPVLPAAVSFSRQPLQNPVCRRNIIQPFHRADIISPLGSRLQISFRNELSVCHIHRCPGNLQRFRKISG